MEVLWEGKEEVKTDLVAPKAAVKMGEVAKVAGEGGGVG